MIRFKAIWGFLAVLLLAALAPLLGRAAQSHWTVENVLREIDRSSKEFRSLTADVQRTKVTIVVNDHSTESGQIAVRGDDKMRIDLTQPDARTLLRDGDHIYLYNPKIHQVDEYDLSKHRALVDQFLLLGFGTSSEVLTKSYVITLQGEETLGNQKVVHLQLTPRSPEVRTQISKIDLWIDETNWLPAQQQFFETGSGDYFTIRYTNVSRNVRLPDSQFKPHWPAGTIRVKPGD